MKMLSLLVLVFVAGCAASPSPSPPVVRVATPSGRILAGQEKGSVRQSEQVKAYPLGRYIDPHNPYLMHEGHTVYRVEATAKWNLRPSRAGGSQVRKQPVSISSPTPPLTRDELVMELNRQRAVTKEVIQGGRAVSEKLAELNDAMRHTQEVAAQNEEFQKALDETKQRLDALEKEAVGEGSGAPSQSSPKQNIEW